MMILFMASYLERYQRELREYWKKHDQAGTAVDEASLVCYCWSRILAQWLWCAALVLAMLFIGGAKLWLFSGLLLAGIGGIASMALISPYRLERLVTFLDPLGASIRQRLSVNPVADRLWSRRVVRGWSGQQYPEIVFSARGPHGFRVLDLCRGVRPDRGCGCARAYSLLVSRIVHVARKAVRQEDWFAAYSCFGIAIVLAGQAFINIGVTSGLLPSKGLTLPFISYGGSSLLVCCAMVALVLRISREMDDVQAVAKQVRRDRAEL